MKPPFSFAVFTFLMLSTLIAFACAPVMRLGERLAIQSEMALIVWDKQQKTEHFIRQAQFATDAADIGFLVPTPTEPELIACDPQTFVELDFATRSQVKWKTKTKSVFRFFDTSGLSETSAPVESAVRVLKQQKVGDYDAAVLKATDATALAKWLNDNEYQSNPELTEWLNIYVTNDWVITAFKLSQGKNARRAIFARPVRLSFQTDKPLYPYREPANMRSGSLKPGSRKLRVFFLADERYDVTLGESQRSTARVVWANPTSSIRRTLGGLTVSALSQQTDLNFEKMGLSNSNAWLTEFEDTASPRNGIDELYFSPAADQSTVERPVIVKTRTVREYYPNLPPFTLWVGLGLIAVGVVRLFRAKSVSKRNNNDSKASA